MTLKQLKTYIHTLRYMKLKQINYRLYYVLRSKLRRIRGYSYVYSIPSNSQKLLLDNSIESYTSYDEKNNRFLFLNLSHSFNEKIDWNYSDHGKLWTYNLNYFEYLNQKEFSLDSGIRLIYEYIDNISKSKDGLEPFPIALRGINWIKFLTLHKIRDPKIDDSLYAQYLILMDNLEYHLLGNHLLENGFSLLFGAYYFSDERLYKKAKEILFTELEEQILGDGAHFELTPMYHQIMFFRVLDCINLICNNNVFHDLSLEDFLKEKAALMFGWLKNITYNNGEIPHFNDSTSGIAPKSEQLFGYAQTLNIIAQIKPLKESGYRKYITNNYELIMDIGNIGPDYIPGHAHSDTLNFELHVHNLPFIVDTAISTYENNEQRIYERSTQAHNTVVINDTNQSQVWSSFRVAKRAKIFNIKESTDYVGAEHDGYMCFGAIHRREFYPQNRKIIIVDEIITPKKRYFEAKAYFHFSETISNIKIEEHKVITENAIFSFEGSKSLEIVDTTIAKGFNRLEVGVCIIVSFEDNIKTIIDINI